MKRHFSLCHCCIHTDDINCIGACHSSARLIQYVTLNVIWTQCVELMKALRAPTAVVESVTVKHLSYQTPALTVNILLCVCVHYMWEWSQKKALCKYAVNQSINRSVMSSCKSPCLPSPSRPAINITVSLNTVLCTTRLTLGKNNRSVNVLAPAVTREPQGGTVGTPGALCVKRVQSGLAWTIQTTTHSIHSSSQQGPAIWTHFCSDRVALKAHLYEGYIHSGPQECACLGESWADLRDDGTTRYIFSPGTLEHVISSTSVFHF